MGIRGGLEGASFCKRYHGADADDLKYSNYCIKRTLAKRLLLGARVARSRTEVVDEDRFCQVIVDLGKVKRAIELQDVDHGGTLWNALWLARHVQAVRG